MAAVEQRQAQRIETASPITIWHPTAKRFFQGSSLNLSRLGALVSMPISTPVRVGQIVEMDISVDRVNWPMNEPLPENVSAKVLRVDRSRLLETGSIDVALRFQQDETRLR